MLGYNLVGPWEAPFPYLLAAASSCFVYVAVADLIPQLQHRVAVRDTLAQLLWLAIGMGLIMGVAQVGASH